MFLSDKKDTLMAKSALQQVFDNQYISFL